MTDERNLSALRDRIRELVLAAIGDAGDLATVDLPDGSIGVIDLNESEVAAVTIRPARFEVVAHG